MKADIVIKNGKIVTANHTYEAGIAIDKEKFIAITRSDELPAARTVIDAQGNFILPGLVDDHVHMQDMGRSEIEDYITGSTAAAVGGVTTVMEMPQTIPPTTSLERFEEKKAVAARKFIVDYALYGGVVPGNSEEIPKMAEAGAIGFKAMMAGSTGLLKSLDDGMLLETYMAIAACGSVITLHAENEAIINYLENKLKAEGRKDVRAFFESRPILGEIEAISRAAMLAKDTGCYLHILHVSCPQGIELIYQRRMEGQQISCETSPRYLVLSEDDMDRLGPYLKFAPPTRSKLDTEWLWRQLADGEIDDLGSDHGGHTRENKEKGWGNIWEAGSGNIGIETMLPIMLSEGVNRGRISLQRLVSVLCETPARIFGIYPQKGAIQVGSDADLVIVDLERDFVIKNETIHSKQKCTPYDGMKVKGMPVLTMVRGEVVMENGAVKGKPGYGKFVTPLR